LNPLHPTSITDPNFKGNSRVRRVLAAAALAGVELDYDSSFSMKSDYKTEEFLKKNPVGYLPFLEDGDFALAESAAIAEYGKCCLPFGLSYSQDWDWKQSNEKQRGRRRSTGGSTDPFPTPNFMMIQ